MLNFAADYANGRTQYPTTTHFHPEHVFGAQVFAGGATFLINRDLAEDLKVKGPGYIDMFNAEISAFGQERIDKRVSRFRT